MSLLGTPLLVIVGVLALAAPTVVLMLWGRVHGSTWLRRGQRAGLVLTAQVVALGFGVVALNDYGEFFTSWSELVGTAAPPHVVATRHVGLPDPVPGDHTQRLPVPVDNYGGRLVAFRSSPLVKATTWAPRRAWRSSGEVVSMRVHGDRTGLSEGALVYLPPAYFQGQREMPVVLVFTGYPGSVRAMVNRMQYPTTLLSEIRKGRAQAMALVMLRPSVTYPRDTECTNVPNGPQAFTFFADEVPDTVARVLGLHPTAYGAVGESTGGLCAAKLAVIDPGRFVAAASLSGYYRAVTDFTTGDLYDHSQRVRDDNDIMWRLTHLAPPRTSLLVATAKTEGGQDGYQPAQQLVAVVRPPMSADEIVLDHGGHSYTTWSSELYDVLPWLSAHLG